MSIDNLQCMSERVLMAFADRMAQVCEELGLPEGRGRNSALARMFEKTPNATKKWLDGTGMPELAKAIEIANRAHVSVLWLLQGAEPKYPVQSDALAGAIACAVSALPKDEELQVADFVRYKLQQPGQNHAAQETKAKYLVNLDAAMSRRPKQE